MNFKDPIVLLLIPVAVVLLLLAQSKVTKPGIRFSSDQFLKSLRSGFKTTLSKYIIFLRIGAVFCVLLALARPQFPMEQSKIKTEGIDIVLLIDVSTSMLAEDFELGGRRVNRLEVAKDVVKDFIEGRPNDRIGIVAFAGRAYTVCPLTLDHDWLFQNLDRVKIAMVEDGTAVGSGIASALNRVKDAKAKSKVIILLTDGVNNAGKISPITAAEAAKALGIKVYTIGAGTDGLAPYPVRDFFGNKVYQPIKIEIDEATLKKIAQETSAKYFRATDTASLKHIYQEIDKLEKTVIEEKGYVEYKELFPMFLIPGLILLLLEVLLTNTFLRRIP
ncbi:MAG: VWA domain-containing protein [Candidatus Omnitrophica bacterium]|nr:VWA domain-containing protein [Candidatus Omnitrophota bacterium]